MNMSVMLFVAQDAGAELGGEAWLLWAIGAGVVVISAGFAYIGRVVMTGDDGKKVAPPGAGLASVALSEEASSMDPTDARAFAALARKFRLSKAQRLAVRRLAQSTGTPAPALLISEHAFDRAADDSGEAVREALAPLRSRVFAE